MKKQIISRLLDGCIVVALLAVLTQTAGANTPPPGTAPDAGSTACLMSAVCAGLVAVRRFIR